MIIKQRNILDKIKNIILASGLSDIELSEKSGLSKEGIYKIRSGKTSSIRSSNANNILKALDYKLESSSNGLKITNLIKPVNFVGIKEMLKKTDNANDTLNFLNTQANTINTFIAQLEEKDILIKQRDQEIQALKKQLNTKDELLLKNSIMMHPLDHSRMQIIVQLDKSNPKFLDVTASYAEYLGYGPFELLGEPYLSVVHEDEFERLSEFEKNPEQAKNENAWKMKHKDGSSVYIKSTARHISKGKIIICHIDIEEISQDDYTQLTSDFWYTPSKGIS